MVVDVKEVLPPHPTGSPPYSVRRTRTPSQRLADKLRMNARPERGGKQKRSRNASEDPAATSSGNEHGGSDQCSDTSAAANSGEKSSRVTGGSKDQEHPSRRFAVVGSHKDNGPAAMPIGSNDQNSRIKSAQAAVKKTNDSKDTKRTSKGRVEMVPTRERGRNDDRGGTSRKVRDPSKPLGAGKKKKKNNNNKKGERVEMVACAARGGAGEGTETMRINNGQTKSSGRHGAADQSEGHVRRQRQRRHQHIPPMHNNSLGETQRPTSNRDYQQSDVAAENQPGAFAISEGTSSGVRQHQEQPTAISSLTRTPGDFEIVTTARLVTPEDTEHQHHQQFNNYDPELGVLGEEVVVAEKAPAFYANHRARMAIFVLLLVIVGVVVGVVLSMIQSSPSSEEGATMIQRHNELTSLVAKASPDDGEAMLRPGSAQFRAFEWLLADPQLSNYTDTRKLERYALGTLFESTNGSHWKVRNEWMNHAISECQWYGLKCTKSGRIRKLELDSNELKGELVDELVLLENLFEAAMTQNSLFGTLPSVYGQFKNLTWFRLWDNKFSGTVPKEWGGLSKLRSLHLHTNKLSGTLCSELGLLSELETLRLYGNMIKGKIPKELGSFKKLKTLGLNNNRLSGEIPAEIGLLESLEEGLYLNNNNIEGTVPSSFALLVNVSEIALERNNLVGTVPTGVCNLFDQGSLSNLWGDCEEIECPCCNVCCVDGGKCSMMDV